MDTAQYSRGFSVMKQMSISKKKNKTTTTTTSIFGTNATEALKRFTTAPKLDFHMENPELTVSSKGTQHTGAHPDETDRRCQLFFGKSELFQGPSPFCYSHSTLFSTITLVHSNKNQYAYIHAWHDFFFFFLFLFNFAQLRLSHAFGTPEKSTAAIDGCRFNGMRWRLPAASRRMQRIEESENKTWAVCALGIFPPPGFVEQAKEITIHTMDSKVRQERSQLFTPDSASSVRACARGSATPPVSDSKVNPNQMRGREK